MKKNGSKILVIDDDATVRTTLRESLELEGYEILEAADGQEGLDMVAAGKPPLVFLDLMMPGMSGIEVLDEMKRRKDLATTKVIVYSASGNRDWQIEVLEKGAWYYLDKDDPIEILLAITRNALEARTAQQAMLDGLRMVQMGLAAATSLTSGPVAHLTDLAQRDEEKGIEMLADLNRLVKLLEQFQRYIDLQGTSVTREPVAIRPLLEETILSCPGSFRQPPEGPDYRCDETIAVAGEAALLREAVGIILANAAKHAITDTPVRISLSIKGKTVILSVANRHAGISEERQRLLFTPFSMPASGAERGFGLDLAIAAVISKLHGGRITCASEPDEWTRFDLRLPIA